jgi:hypothetical protein
VDLATWGLTVHWRAGLDYYEARFRLVRELLTMSESGSWRRGDEESVLVRLFGGAMEVIAGPESLTVSAVNPDEGPTEAIVDTCFRLAAPDRVTGVVTLVQHLVPMQMDYDAARRHASTIFMPTLAATLPPVDFAILYDADTSDWGRKSEFGVVSTEEIPKRLSRAVGRMQQYGSPRPVAFWKRFTFPSVALFIDSYWQVISPPSDPNPSWVLRTHREMREDCQTQASLIAKLLENN